MKNYVEAFTDLELNQKQKAYLDYHSVRYGFLVKEVLELSARVQSEKKGNELRILDIGPSLQTFLLRKVLPGATINTLGFKNSFNESRPHEYHSTFNLNNSKSELDRESDPHDIVVFCEVLEHLHTSPKFVLKFIKRFVSDSGFLILQTPNAVALPNRMRMMVGQNPFMLIRDDERNPGHFREYTLSELHTYLKQTGYTIVKSHRRNYFKGTSFIHKMYNLSSIILPPGLKQGIMIVAKKS